MLSLTEQLNRGPVVSDGAMATELEKRGVATNSALWSATAMLDHPDAIQTVHQSYLDAGAKIMTTNTYQANVPAFEQAGIAAAQARQLIQQAVTIAHTARDASHVTDAVIAGSIGPYGAYLADGSEYTGAYQLTPSAYQDFHRERLALIMAAGVDVLALETMPRLDEVQALVQLITTTWTQQPYWVSFSIKDPQTLCDGTSLAVAAKWVAAQPNVVAVGVNCTTLENIAPALTTLKAAVAVPLIVYPNSGDQYDPVTKTWQETHLSHQFASFVPQWLAAGARIIGGCCRTTPKDIATVARALSVSDSAKL
ncbi:homocysteine S-methyltransferase [Lactiplantibacillus plantarum]|jgi:homocysteine S-methyltransferase|uniref:homocysteine S-methyltransferase n=1 Tax=Lactiplantibacillus plantarum TaxID=1590 RepID=UPI000398D370|nr:homocysteine S-methyltransferase [Lactiplantibacillus plantarum]ERJ48994.1 homocysteine methyltransferase [Lactiplantibacillus plantarum 2165]TYA18992.1 homocysteine S-methyltransferase [Lactobacillus sp. LSI2-1]ALC08293.1 homocysteine methyltransferase [Lactiplantibacillus plantarum]AQX93166.1 homocysteine S-methyltransferase [Lactiplantibacillus plantarum]AWL15218.1 homocysteine S-methyltransferase [Lactiplantibacillus plantarum]